MLKAKPMVESAQVIMQEDDVLAAPPPECGVPPFHALRLHRFSVAQFEKLLDSGVLGPDPRVELLEGWVVDKMTVHPPHAIGISLANRVLTALLPEGWILRPQLPITTSDSQPEPDFAVVRGPERRYARHPRAKDIGLLIEVSDTSLETDREDMGRIYARAGVVIYWIINLQDGMVEVYTKPKGGKTPRYTQRQVFQRADRVPLILDDVVIAKIPVADLLP